MLVSNNIANYKIVCCETVRSAILATAWLLVAFKADLGLAHQNDLSPHGQLRM